MPEQSHGSVFALDGVEPDIAADAYLAPGAVVIGRVRIGSGSSIWCNAVLRGDGEPISVGLRTNIQDGSVVHTDPGYPCTIGSDITIGHGAIIHGCTLEDRVTVGMGAVILTGCHVGAGAVIAAGAVVPEGTVVPPGVLMMGMPAKERRPVTPEEAKRFAWGGAHYVENGARFVGGLKPAGGE